MKRGQASLEYLNTYGWAIMVLLIMVGVLSQFNVFNPDIYMRDTCYTGNQLTCIETGIDENGYLYLGLRNNHNVDIEIINITTSLFNEEPHQIEHVIRRGDTRIFRMPATDQTLVPPSKQEIGLRIDFKRRDGSNVYSIFGSTRTGFVSSSSATFTQLSSMRVYTTSDGWLPVCVGSANTFCGQLGFDSGSTGDDIETSVSCAQFVSDNWQQTTGTISEITCS